MDPIVAALGTALLGAITNDGWTKAKNVVVGWWRRVRPNDADQIGIDLDKLHTEAAAARASGDTATTDALTGEWRLRLHRLLTEDPTLRTELERLLNDDLTPLLSAGDKSNVAALTQTAKVEGKGHTVIQSGGDTHYNR
ncbi:hypothetical protein [Nocardia salmonicida]|uniref:hypothetical protein n=1 Tax=Nocardia salmonicida TaxID=53431 RepID=UPI003CFAC66C